MVTMADSVKCKVITKHQPVFIKSGKYGLTVTRLDSPPPGGAHNPTQLKDDKALFDILFDLGYSAPEITNITEQVEPSGSDFTDPERMIAQAALERHGF